jgi:hypothetical protein
LSGFNWPQIALSMRASYAQNKLGTTSDAAA